MDKITVNKSLLIETIRSEIEKLIKNCSVSSSRWYAIQLAMNKIISVIENEEVENKEAENKNDIQKMIAEECDAIKNLLIEKNKAYGNSAIEPLRIFSKLNNIEQIKVRIDDKLSRLKTAAQTSIQEDTEQDLIGYLILFRICKKIGEKIEKEK